MDARSFDTQCRRMSLVTKTAGVLNVVRCEPGGQLPGQVVVAGAGAPMQAGMPTTVVQMQGATHYPPAGGY